MKLRENVKAIKWLTVGSKGMVERLRSGKQMWSAAREEDTRSQFGNESPGLSGPLNIMGYLCYNRNKEHHRIMPSSLQWLANWVWKLLTEHRIGMPFFTPTRISQVEGMVLTSLRMMETLSCFWFTWGRRCLHLHGCQTMEPLVLKNVKPQRRKQWMWPPHRPASLEPEKAIRTGGRELGVSQWMCSPQEEGAHTLEKQEDPM